MSIAEQLSITDDQLALVLAHDKCPPRDKFKTERTYIKRLGQLAKRLKLVKPKQPTEAEKKLGKATRTRARTTPRVKRTTEEKRVANLAAVTKHRQGKRELPEFPAVVDQERRDACSKSFQLHCETYHGRTFYSEWGPDHIKVIAKIESAVMKGGRFCLAVFRGFGKTQLCMAALVWMTVNGHKHFPVLIGPDKESAQEILALVQYELQGNAILAEDYPEICGPFTATEGSAQKARYLTYKGKPLKIEMKLERLRFPVTGSPTDGTLIKCFGITGKIRGQSDAKAGRPDFALIDDAQTDESARSPSQVTARLKTVTRSILGLAGRDKKISAVMPCTVIEPDDLTSQVLRNKAWQDFHGKLVYKFPDRQDLWDEYAQIRLRVLKEDEFAQEATDFYLAHRAEMDAGAEIAWETMWAEDEGEVSAIQSAMNLKIDDEDCFWAEYQNEPRIPDNQFSKIPGLAHIEKSRTGMGRNIIPPWASIVTAAFDLQEEVIWWMVCAFSPVFRCSVINYGTYPDQQRGFFKNRTAPRPLSMFHDGGPDARMLAGAKKGVQEILDHDFKRPNGQIVPVSILNIDAGHKPEVARAVRRLHGGDTVRVTHGRGIMVDNKPMTEYTPKPGDVFGLDWYTPAITSSGEPHTLYDSNAWKTRVLNSWNTPQGDPGDWSIYGHKDTYHPLLAQQLFQSETYVEAEGKTRKILEWRNTSQRDNHWFDTLNMNYVAASMAGAKWIAEKEEKKERKRQRRSLKELRDIAKRRR